MLAEHLHMPVREAMDRIAADEFVFWMAHLELSSEEAERRRKE